jgi:hypothetical protein
MTTSPRLYLRARQSIDLPPPAALCEIAHLRHDVGDHPLLDRYRGDPPLNAFMPFEAGGFNCERGRIEARDHERQARELPYETEILVARSFAKEVQRVTLQKLEGGHSGGDPRLLVRCSA